uniref:hypothetical protein n=1 Tax=Myxococcus vastator TaxID=2709664 RepID=UPI0013D2F4F6
MRVSSDEMLVWKYQNEFIQSAGKIVRGMFGRLGVRALPRLGFVAISWSPEKRPSVFSGDESIQWNPALDELKKGVDAYESDESRLVHLRAQILREFASTVSVGGVVKEDLRRHDAESGTRSFCSMGAVIGVYDSVFVLEFDATEFARFPVARFPSDVDGEDDCVGLLSAVAEALLERIAREARHGNAGLR